MLKSKTGEDSRTKSGRTAGRPFLKPMPDRVDRRICMLIVTHKCNLNCRYCYESDIESAFPKYQ